MKTGEYLVWRTTGVRPSAVRYVRGKRPGDETGLPRMFESVGVQPVDHYPQELAEDAAIHSPPPGVEYPRVVLLTPGASNSAYFEPPYLAAQMGIEIVGGPRPVREGRARVSCAPPSGLQPVMWNLPAAG